MVLSLRQNAPERTDGEMLGGSLYLSAPVALQRRTLFNAHRYLSTTELHTSFDPFEIVIEEFINMDKIEDIFPETPRGMVTGLFVLRKPVL